MDTDIIQKPKKGKNGFKMLDKTFQQIFAKVWPILVTLL